MKLTSYASAKSVISAISNNDSMNNYMNDDNYESDSEISKETFHLRISKERIDFINFLETFNLKLPENGHSQILD